MAKRGCGVRSPGGIYIEVKLSAGGTPLWKFLVDPTVESPEGLDMPARGVMIAERVVKGQKTGIYDVYDRVGSKHYPNVLDFYREVGKLGASRRVSQNADFAKLSPESRLILLHERAVLANANQLYAALRKEDAEYGSHVNGWCCQCGIVDHQHYPDMAGNDPMPTCIGSHWQIVTGGDVLYDPTKPPRSVRREIGDITYTARKAPDGFKPEYKEGIFLILPISNLAVIRDPEGGQDTKALEKAGRANLDISLEDA